MSVTETDLVNAALRKVGARRIEDIGGQFPSSDVAQDTLSHERDALLRNHLWNFAVNRKKLNQLTDTPVYEFEYAYALPADWLRTIAVHSNDAGTGRLEYRMETIEVSGTYQSVILADAEDVWLRYVRKVTDPALMTASFRQVLIFALAKVFAMSTANSNTLYDIMNSEYERALRQARSIDGIEDYPPKLPEGSWASNRHGRWPHTDNRWPE